MYAKAVALIVLATAVGAVLISLRQQTFEAQHEITRSHTRLHANRRAAWEAQTRAAQQLKPQALEHRLKVAELHLEPIAQPDAPPSLTAPVFAAGEGEVVLQP